MCRGDFFTTLDPANPYREDKNDWATGDRIMKKGGFHLSFCYSTHAFEDSVPVIWPCP